MGNSTDPTLEILRADDVSAPGAITSDILTRLMHAEIVVADITFPNPNVFYELGLRHAYKTGPIIIRDRQGPRVPFDVAHLRHIEYENTPSGLKGLSNTFKGYLDHFIRNPTAADSQFQELARLTKFHFPDYSDPRDELAPEAVAMLAMLQSPELMDLFTRQSRGEQVDQRQVLEVMAKNPAIAGIVIQALVKSGHLDFGSPTSTTSRPAPARGKPSKNKRKRH